METLPKNYKIIQGDEFENVPGILAGSSQPGYYMKPLSYSEVPKDSQILEYLTEGFDIENSVLDKEVMNDFKALYEQGVRMIYSVALGSEHGDNEDRDPELLKYLWENKFKDTKYVTQVLNEKGETVKQKWIKKVAPNDKGSTRDKGMTH